MTPAGQEPRAAARGETLPGLVLQRLPLSPPVAMRELYLRAAPGTFPGQARPEAGLLRLEAAASVSFDTYFGAFFEAAWRAATDLAGVTLDLRARGKLALRVLRRTAEGAETTLHEALVEGDGWTSVPLPAPAAPAAAGRLFAEVVALGEGCRIEALQWRAPEARAARVGLVPVFCTFGREAQLGAALATIAAEPSCWQDLPRLVVVNQGRPGLTAHPAMAGLPPGFRERLLVVEQGNFGGAGGFTRGLIEARRIPGATHALLMDDDVGVEAEALRRVAAFFALAHPRVALGGHMLDMLQPARLYEAGARVDPRRWGLQPLKQGLPLRETWALDVLSRREPIGYNGWWFFGLPLALLEEAGLPLPCFIRGDDVEYGMRLHALGARTVDLPGAAVWHEPFYARLNNWQLYYETRNMLVAAAVHMPKPPGTLALLFARRLLNHLLTYRYYSAALMLRAAEDYLRGPTLFHGAPAALHAALEADRAAFPSEEIGRERLLADARPAPDMGSVPVVVLRLARAVLRNWVVAPAPATRPLRLAAHDLIWFRMGRMDHVAADTGWDARPPVFRRPRGAYRKLLRRGIAVMLRLLRDGGRAERQWRAAHPQLTGEAFWRSHLALDGAMAAQPDDARSARRVEVFT